MTKFGTNFVFEFAAPDRLSTGADPCGISSLDHELLDHLKQKSSSLTDNLSINSTYVESHDYKDHDVIHVGHEKYH